MPNPFSYSIYPCGDHAITVELGEGISEEVNDAVMALFALFRKEPLEHVKDLIPAYNSLTLIYDPLALVMGGPPGNAYGHIREAVQRKIDRLIIGVNAARTMRIPVCYDLAVAPDLEMLAAVRGLSTEEVIRLHTERTYRVYMIGFLPGFAYMGTLDEKIALPRKDSPRTSVPAGSVGIAGLQTGIYPLASPGGWQLIGRTAIELFDASKPDPCYLQPGDKVQFYSIPLTEFQKMKKP